MRSILTRKKTALASLFFTFFAFGSLVFGIKSVDAAAPLVCNKNSCVFTHLAPIGIINGGSKTTDVGGGGADKYLKDLYKAGIVLASGLAVIMIVLGGAQYASTDAIGGKSDGKKRIQAALTGLVLALLSYTILNTINSNLVNVSFTPSMIAPTAGTPAVTPVTDGSTLAQGVDANGNPCTVGTTGCTSTGTLGGTNPNPDASASNLTNANTDYGNTLGNGGRVTRFAGSVDSTTAYNETGSVSGEYLRNLDPTSDLYAAYPLSGHTVPGLPNYANTGTANRQLANQVVRVTTNNGSTFDMRIVDRGPGNRNNFDVSALADQRIHQGGGIANLQLVPH